MFKFKTLMLCAAMLFIFGGAIQANAQDDDEAGGYVAARVTDASVKAAAAFAVKEKARRSGDTIVLMSIKSAKQQVVAGMNFDLCIEVKSKGKNDDEVEELYVKTVVYRNLQNVFSLTSWFVEECYTGD